jgi:hypothetical protein
VLTGVRRPANLLGRRKLRPMWDSPRELSAVRSLLIICGPSQQRLQITALQICDKPVLSDWIVS